MPERKTQSEEKPQEDQAKPQVSRRGFLFGAGAGVAGLAVGGVAGSQVFPKQAADTPTPVPAKWVGRDFTACQGCKNCQIACSKAKEGKIWPKASRVTVHEYLPGVEFPVLCYQCADNAKCVEKCPAKALSVDAQNNAVIKIDTTKCLRTAKNGDCTICRDECPGTAVTFHPVTRAPLICDLCNGDPACTKVCPQGPMKGALHNNGFRAAPAKPDTIAAGLQAKYVLQALPAKTGAAFEQLADAETSDFMA
ncbi:MAG TPA: 4Fe-4S dicluster domain-containing protein [Anaerolineae bacterium]